MNALQEAMSAARRTPTDKEAWLKLGAILVAEGQPERARDCFERALWLDPTDEEARRALRTLGGEGDEAGSDDGDMATTLDDLDFDPATELDDLDFDRATGLDDLDLGSPLDENGASAGGGAEPFGTPPRRPRLQGAARLWAALGLVGLGAFLCLCGLIFFIALLFRG